MFEIKLALIKLKNKSKTIKKPSYLNFDQLSFCDWRKSPAPNPHQSVPLFIKGVVYASRLGGGMFKAPIAAEYFFKKSPPKKFMISNRNKY